MGTQLPPWKGAQQPPTFQLTSIVAKRSPVSATAELLFDKVHIMVVDNRTADSRDKLLCNKINVIKCNKIMTYHLVKLNSQFRALSSK